jgi:hypothetical protein
MVVRLSEWVVAANVSMGWIRSSRERRCLLNRHAERKKALRNCPKRNNPECNNPETRKNP